MSEPTPRELEVLMLIIAGKSNKEIGRDLEISFRTVDAHRAALMRKLGANSAADLVRIGMCMPPIDRSDLRWLIVNKQGCANVMPSDAEGETCGLEGAGGCGCLALADAILDQSPVGRFLARVMGEGGGRT